jgi:hypothetical protein
MLMHLFGIALLGLEAPSQNHHRGPRKNSNFFHIIAPQCLSSILPALSGSGITGNMRELEKNLIKYFCHTTIHKHDYA